MEYVECTYFSRAWLSDGTVDALPLEYMLAIVELSASCQGRHRAGIHDDINRLVGFCSLIGRLIAATFFLRRFHLKLHSHLWQT